MFGPSNERLNYWTICTDGSRRLRYESGNWHARKTGQGTQSMHWRTMQHKGRCGWQSELHRVVVPIESVHGLSIGTSLTIQPCQAPRYARPVFYSARNASATALASASVQRGGVWAPFGSSKSNHVRTRSLPSCHFGPSKTPSEGEKPARCTAHGVCCEPNKLLASFRGTHAIADEGETPRPARTSRNWATKTRDAQAMEVGRRDRGETTQTRA